MKMYEAAIFFTVTAVGAIAVSAKAVPDAQCPNVCVHLKVAFSAAQAE